jgi:uncharacterized membrane protein
VTTARTLDDLALELLGKSLDALSPAERRVLSRIHKREVTALNMGVTHEEDATFGERLSDHVAAIGGSWAFILSFGLVLFGWMILNSEILGPMGKAFDPYPFIFLNLLLSTLAAVQAPIIMMSQNRQADKDRTVAAHDYEVNLRAELEILRLHEKVNRLIDKMDALAAANDGNQAA